jgi:hypothetical protein
LKCRRGARSLEPVGTLSPLVFLNSQGVVALRSEVPDAACTAVRDTHLLLGNPSGAGTPSLVGSRLTLVERTRSTLAEYGGP